MTRAIGRGLRAAVAVMLLALAGAALFPQSGGERFATSAYLAAIFAAVLLAVRRCLPEAERSRSTPGGSSIPAVVAFWLIVAGALAASAVAAGSLGAELLVGVMGMIAVVVAALFPSGLFAPLHREFSKDGTVAMVIRYAVMLGIAGWAVAATVPAANAAAPFGFAMLVAASAWMIASLRPLRDIIGAAAVTSALAFAIAACSPAAAQVAACVGYATAILVMGLLVVRARYA